MTKFSKTLIGSLLLAVGFVTGLVVGDMDEVLPTRGFVADRMAECAQTVRIHEKAQASGDAELERIVLGDMNQCRMLIARHSGKIADQDQDTVQRLSKAD